MLSPDSSTRELAFTWALNLKTDEMINYRQILQELIAKGIDDEDPMIRHSKHRTD